MNKIFSIVRNSHGQLVVANEYAKSSHGSSKIKMGLTKLSGVLMGAFLTAGIATAQVTSSQGGLAGGVASGDSSIAIGESSWTTSEHGSSAGAGSIATGGDMTREQFEELLKSIEDDRKAREEKLKERAQVAVKINSNIKQIQDLNTTIKGYDELIKQNQQNQAAIQNLQNQINTKNNAKETLTESQAFKDAMTNYENYKAGTLGRNINEYANFTALINGLSWNTTDTGGQSLKEFLSQELANRIKSASPNIYEKYKGEDAQVGKTELDRYRDYITKYTGELGQRQGVYDGLINKYENKYRIFSSDVRNLGFSIRTLRFVAGLYKLNIDKKVREYDGYSNSLNNFYNGSYKSGSIIKKKYEGSSNNKVDALNYYLAGITNETINNIMDDDGVLDFSKSNLYMVNKGGNNSELKDDIIAFNTSLASNYNNSTNFLNTSLKLKQGLIAENFGSEYSELVSPINLKIESKNSDNDVDISSYFASNDIYSGDNINGNHLNPSSGMFVSGSNQNQASLATIYGGDITTSPVAIINNNVFSVPTSVRSLLFMNGGLLSNIDFIKEKQAIESQIAKSNRIINEITSENYFKVSEDIRVQGNGFDAEQYNVLFAQYKEAEKNKLNLLKELVGDEGIYTKAADIQQRTANGEKVSEEEKQAVAQKLEAEQKRLKELFELSSESDFSQLVGFSKQNALNQFIKDSYFKTREILFNPLLSGQRTRTVYEFALSPQGVAKYNNNFAAWQAETQEVRDDLYKDLVVFDNEDSLIKDVTKEAQDIINAYNSKQSELNNLNNQIDDLNKQLEALDGGGDIATANSERQKAIDEKNKLEAQKEALDNQLNGLGEELAKLDQQIAEKFNLQKGQSSLAQGNGSFASGDHSVAIGTESSAMNNSAIAIGNTATASGEGAIALGKESVASSKNSVAIGVSNAVTGEGSITVGSSNVVNGANSVAMGQSNQITGEKSVAVGFGHVIKGNNSGAFGDPNIIEANNAYALGNNNKVYADNVLTFGNDNTIGTQPTEGDGVAPENRAGYASTAIGNNVNVQGKNSVVIGNQTSSANDYNIVLGYGSSDAYTPPATTSTDTMPSTGNNSAPTGSGSIVSVGNASEGLFRKIVNVAEGAISSTSKEAINGSQLNELNTKITNLLNLKSDIDKAIEDLKNNVQNLNITDPAITVTQRSGEATPNDKTDDVYQGSVLGALSDEQKAAGVNSLVLTDLAAGNVSANSKDAITGAQLNTTANDIAKHLGGGATNNGGSITAPSYTVTDVDGKTDKSYNNVGDAVDALNKLAKSGANTEKAFESVAQNLGGGATYDKENKVVTKPTYNVTDVANDKVQAHDNVGSAIEALDNNDKALATAVTYNANNIALLGQSVNAMGQNLNGLNQAVGQLSNQVSRNTENIQRMQNDIANNRKEARAGTAAAMAMATLPQPWRPSQTSVAMGAATYRGEHGAAIGVSRLSDNGKFMIKSAINVNTKSGFGAAVGAAWYFD